MDGCFDTAYRLKVPFQELGGFIRRGYRIQPLMDFVESGDKPLQAGIVQNRVVHGNGGLFTRTAFWILL